MDYTESVYHPAGIKVLLGQKNSLESKASGAIDTEEFWKWKDTQIHIYAFRKGSNDFSVKSAGSCCILDGTADGCPNAGKAAMISGGNDFITWKECESTPTYPEGTDPHDFYAYYIDDCQIDDSDITRDVESIRMPVTITGVQDLMTARAVISEDQLERLGYTRKEKEILMEASYSAYSANVGVHPELHFKHYLVRLDFEAYPARSEAADIWIQGLSVESRTEAEFTVAHVDTSKIGLVFAEGQEMTPLHLMEKDCQSVLIQDKYNVPWEEADDSKPLYERSCLPIGGSLLLSPEKSYNCTVMMQDNHNNNIRYKFNIKSAAGTFESGKQYTGRLGIYGRNKIVSDVVIRDWKDD